MPQETVSRYGLGLLSALRAGTFDPEAVMASVTAPLMGGGAAITPQVSSSDSGVSSAIAAMATAQADQPPPRVILSDDRDVIRKLADDPSFTNYVQSTVSSDPASVGIQP
jgi:hypothetical protein